MGVDEGADALLAAGRRPHLVVGDPRLMSEDVLECGRRAGHPRRPGRQRARPAPAEQSGVEPVIFAMSGSSEDAALLLVDAHDPALIVGVGWHPTLAALVDSGRSDMPSAFLTRLRLGDRFVDASSVAALHRRPARTWPLWLLMLVLLAGLVATVVLATRRDTAGATCGRAWWTPRTTSSAGRRPVTGVRHLLLATVAAVLALALGLALGAGPVVEPLRCDPGLAGRAAGRPDGSAGGTGWPGSRTAPAPMPGWWPRWPDR